jgi:CRISPR-associated protein Csm1
MTSLLDSSSRVAFAALCHDLGKFAERAAPDVSKEKLDAHLNQYSRFHKEGGYFSHRHAAYTALFMDEIEKTAPDLISGETFPFASRSQGNDDITDSLINAAAMHHKPETLLQWIIATADRMASGFEREKFDQYNDSEDKTDTGRNNFQARELTLFEQVHLEDNAVRITPASLKYRYFLKPLSPENLFPVLRDDYEPDKNEPAQKEYRVLWDEFLKALEKIPKSHRQQWPLWLDHFDTLWQTYTQAIPSATAFGIRPEVSLYDHSKATAAFAVALWRWHIAQKDLDNATAIQQHKDRADWDEDKFLLVQGDFFGIQDFIFADGSETNKNAAKLLRGRSFMVSLFTELAALKILEVCELPSTSQIINAAGKFLIVVPNTPEIQEKLSALRKEISQWFLKNFFGTAGIGIVGKKASCNDFISKNFSELNKQLYELLDKAKLQRFNLTGDAPVVFSDVDYSHGVCRYNARLPADDERGSSPISRDQIFIGKALAHQDRLLVVKDDSALRKGSIDVLETSFFGYRVGFTADQEVTGKFGELAASGDLLRCWDFSLPENMTDTLWNGYARRYINAYVPEIGDLDNQTQEKYIGCEEEGVDVKAPKTFNHLACEDRKLDENGKWIGQVAIATLKGDVDNLGLIFQKGLGKEDMTFAKMAALSRQLNAFFAIWLPAYCKKYYPNAYTVFAGGDDFFLIGPWRSTQNLASEMAKEFKRFVAENPEIHFSAGFAITKPGHPIHTLKEKAEDALEASKVYPQDSKLKNKNAVTLFGETLSWKDWEQLSNLESRIEELAEKYKLSTGYVYGLLHLIDLATDKENPESAMWRSRFAYRTRRYVVDKLPPEAREIAQNELAASFGEAGIANQKRNFRIPLFNYFYSKR